MYGYKKRKGYRYTGEEYLPLKKTKRKSGGSKLKVVFKKGRKRWTKYFKSMASMKRAKAGLKTVGWRC